MPPKTKDAIKTPEKQEKSPLDHFLQLISSIDKPEVKDVVLAVGKKDLYDNLCIIKTYIDSLIKGVDSLFENARIATFVLRAKTAFKNVKIDSLESLMSKFKKIEISRDAVNLILGTEIIALDEAIIHGYKTEVENEKKPPKFKLILKVLNNLGFRYKLIISTKISDSDSSEIISRCILVEDLNALIYVADRNDIKPIVLQLPKTKKVEKVYLQYLNKTLSEIEELGATDGFKYATITISSNSAQTAEMSSAEKFETSVSEFLGNLERLRTRRKNTKASNPEQINLKINNVEVIIKGMKIKIISQENHLNSTDAETDDCYITFHLQNGIGIKVMQNSDEVYIQYTGFNGFNCDKIEEDGNFNDNFVSSLRDVLRLTNNLELRMVGIGLRAERDIESEWLGFAKFESPDEIHHYGPVEAISNKLIKEISSGDESFNIRDKRAQSRIRTYFKINKVVPVKIAHIRDSQNAYCWEDHWESLKEVLLAPEGTKQEIK